MTESFDWSAALSALLRGEDLSEQVCQEAMAQIVAGQATDAQIAGLVVALRAKGETAAEVKGFVEAMLAVAVPLQVPAPSLDIVGTGGDASGSVNISTMASLVAAAAGARVVKHGNRAASSKCGSADVLEALGVRIDIAPEDIAAVVDAVGIAFCFAPTFHPAMRHAAAVRRQLGVPTVFNILGPLSNPAQPAASLIGVADRRLAPVMAEVVAQQGRSVIVVRGADGLDEATVSGPSELWWADGDQVRRGAVDPQQLGLPPRDASLLAGGDAQANAATARQVLAGERSAVLDVVREAVLLNAALGLIAWEQAVAEPLWGPGHGPEVQRVGAAMQAAADAVDSGRALGLLETWVDLSRQS